MNSCQVEQSFYLHLIIVVNFAIFRSLTMRELLYSLDSIRTWWLQVCRSSSTNSQERSWVLRWSNIIVISLFKVFLFTSSHDLMLVSARPIIFLFSYGYITLWFIVIIYLSAPCCIVNDWSIVWKVKGTTLVRVIGKLICFMHILCLYLFDSHQLTLQLEEVLVHF